MTGKTALLVLASIVYSRQLVDGFTSGPPYQACPTLSPFPAAHGGPPQTSSVPYHINLSSLIDESGSFSYEPEVPYKRKVYV